MAPDQESASTVILVVESDVLTHMVVTDMLADEGYDVIEARDSREALSLLEARTDIQIVLTSRRTSGKIDGFVLAQIIQRRWPEIGIIVTSGARWSSHELPAGAHFLSKPYTYQALLSAVSSLLSEKVGAAPVLPQGLPSGAGVGEAIQVATPLAEPDKS